MKRLLKHELFKFFQSTGFKILFIILVALTVFSSVILIVAYNFTDGLISITGMTATFLAIADISDLSIVIAIIVSMIVINDFKSDTLKNTVMYNLTREKIFFAKYIVQIIAVTLLIFLYTILQLGVYTLSFGWGEAFTFTSFWNNSLKIFIMGMLLYYAITAFLNLLAYLTKSTVLVIVSIFIITLVLSILTLAGQYLESPIIDFFNEISITSVLMKYYMEQTTLNLVYYFISVSLLFFPSIIWGLLKFKKQEIK